MSHPEGSEWRRWDLHVHTPRSHTAVYGAEPGSWTRFFDELRQLPESLSVVGINDYMWIDGYEIVRDQHLAGNLPNLEAVFPVIELRIDDFIGTDGRLSRLNAHVIFAPGTDPELIRSQFIARLFTKFKLTDGYSHLQTRWSAVPTRDAIAELGKLIKSTVPPEELSRYTDDFTEGLNNWVIPLRNIESAVADATFPEPPLLGLGKTEWADIPWNNNTIAAKKHLISSVDLLFTASSSPSACVKSVEQLEVASVNHRLLDCSDAHHYADSSEKDRLGNCFTWICADPTLAGLKHALLEYSSRVFIGDKPPLLVRRQADPTHFMSSVRIRPTTAEVLPVPSFDVTIPINSGFVAIIGNKGSGKSALLDSIALGGNSRTEGHFTFLSERRFRNPRNNKAPHYQVELSMSDGENIGPVALSAHVDLDSPERIRYLPQSLLETLCNKEPGSPDDSFERELRSIIFSHVPEHQRLDCRSLDELLSQRGEALDHEVDHRRVELADVNRSIVELEEASRPSRIRALRAKLQAVQKQLANHDGTRPPEPVAPEPATNPEVLAASEQLAVVRTQMLELQQQQSEAEASYSTQRARVDAGANLVRELDILQSTFSSFLDRALPLADEVGVQLGDLVRLEVTLSSLEEARADATAKVAQLDQELDPDGPIETSRAQLRHTERTLESALDLPQRAYEQQRRDLEAWSEARAKLVGSATVEDTLEYLTARLDDAETIPERLAELRRSRSAISYDIHNSLLAKVALYRELYGPVQKFLDGNDLARAHFSLEFEADLEMRAFTERFLSFVDRGSSGTFYGIDASEKRVQHQVRTTYPHDWQSIAAFLEAHDLDLRFDRRSGDTGTALDNAADVLRKGVRLEEVYDYLFGLAYLDAEYELRSDGRPITELSPGQKGTILLMFYLLVDQSGRPIALDQPDENLDNQTIHALLRPAIRAAKANRQILVVTHSPNLAVVGDADQVIVASCDGNDFSYVSGSIENPSIRDLVVRVLEGTWPAFADRNKKYLTSAREDVDEVLSP